MTWWRRSRTPSSSRPITPTRWCPWSKRRRPPGSRSSPMTQTWPIPPRVSGSLTKGPSLVGAALVDVVAEQAGASARFAVVSTDPGAFSQNSWIAAMKAQMQAKYPKMQLVDIRYGLGKPAESFSMAQDLINKFRGQLDAIVAPTVVALPKVAEAVEQAGLTGKIVVTGLSTPNDMKE